METLLGRNKAYHILFHLFLSHRLHLYSFLSLHNSQFPPPPSLSLRSTAPVSLKKTASLLGLLNTSKLVTVRLGTNPHIKNGKNNLVGGEGFHGHAKELKTPPISTVGVPKNTKLHNHNICRGPTSYSFCLYDCPFSLCEVFWAPLTRWYGPCSCGVLGSLTPTILPPFFHGIPLAPPMCDYGSLHLSTSYFINEQNSSHLDVPLLNFIVLHAV